MKHFTLISFVSAIIIATPTFAEPTALEEKGRMIAIEADERISGFGESEEIFEMVLIDKRGRERNRQMRVQTLERENGHDWSLSIFDSPADVKGTAFLSHTHGLEPDDQWIFLPALKRIKRISSKNRAGAFMGSEFSFEDLSAFAPEKYQYAYLRDERCGALECHVTDWVPQYENSGYSRITVWNDVDEFRAHKVEYYDQSGEHLKTLIVSDHQKFDDLYWRPMTMIMENHKSGDTTRLNYLSYDFNVELDESDFNLSALRRAK